MPRVKFLLVLFLIVFFTQGLHTQVYEADTMMDVLNVIR